MKRGHILLFCSAITILGLFIVLKYGFLQLPRITGYLSSGTTDGNVLYIEEYDLMISGIDKDGVTYFCLPSFADLTDIDMTSSVTKIRLPDGSVLSRPCIGSIQDVLVDMDNGEQVPWKICFMKSENIYSVFVDMKGMDIEDIDHDMYSPIDVTVVSPMGRLICKNDAGMIKGRGNATWDLGGFYPEKRPYEIRFLEKHPLGSISPVKKWTLLANAYEGTGILNKMVFDTAKNMDMPYVTNAEWADLYAGGRYLGNYLVCSEPQVSASYIADIGGFLLEKNDRYFDDKAYGIRTSHDAFTVKAPDIVYENDLDDIRAFLEKIDSDLHSKEGKSDDIDMDSFVRWYILEELFFNDDALVSSCFFYTGKDKDMLYAGPPWDFDGTCGDDYGRYVDYNESILDTPEERSPIDWYELLCKDPGFMEQVHSVFREYIPVYKRLITEEIDDYHDIVSASMKMNRAVYGRSGYGPDYTVPGYYDSVDNNFRYTKFFLYNRIRHLSDIWDYDGRIPSVKTDNGSAHEVRFVFPDQHTETITVPDGTQLDPSDLPSYDTEKYKGWVYEANDLSPSFYIPVYEDTTFVLEEYTEDQNI